MKNENVIYIDYFESYLEIGKSKHPKWLKKILYCIYNFFGIITVNANNLTIICKENGKINKKTLKKLNKKIDDLNKRNLVCADLILKNKF